MFLCNICILFSIFPVLPYQEQKKGKGGGGVRDKHVVIGH